MSLVSYIRPVVFLGFLVVAVGCTTSRHHSGRPEWIERPKTDDSLYLYRVGHSSGQTTKEAARDGALHDAMRQIARIFITSVQDGDVTNAITSSFQLRNVEIVPGCFYSEEADAKFDGWVQVSFPIEEKKKIQGRIEAGEKLNRLWMDAQTEARQGKYENAGKQLDQIFGGKDQALFMKVDLDEARILQGDVYRGKKDFLEARRCYDQVISTSTSDKWKQMATDQIAQLPEPPRFWQMRDRWGGRKVALICALRDDKECRRFGDMTGAFVRDCSETKMEAVDISHGLTSSQMSNFFDKMDMDTVCKSAAAANAGIVFGVLFDIDPAKRGTTISQFGMNVPVPDTTVKVFVVRVADGKLMFSDQFKDVAGSRPESGLAERAATVVITKHLVPNCPTIPAK